MTFAIHRLERALARVEQGVTKEGSPIAAPYDAGLAGRHRFLLQEVDTALHQIDALIAAVEADRHG